MPRITRLHPPVTTFDLSGIGLGAVDNTSDMDKPVSTAQQAALDLKQNVIPTGTTSQYYRGDKTWQALNKAAVGLSNVDNVSDANKPVSGPQQTALNSKVSTTVLTTKGDMFVATGSGVVGRLPVGTPGWMLVADPASSLGASWVEPASISTPLTVADHPTLANVGVMTVLSSSASVTNHPTMQNIGRITL